MTRDGKTLSVVIVNYDTWPDVLSQVEVLARSSEIQNGTAEVIVVDNDSPSGLPPGRPCVQGIEWVDREENGGFAAGVNAGWRRSRGEWVLLLNPDVVIKDDLLSHVLALLDEIERRPGEAEGISRSQEAS